MSKFADAAYGELVTVILDDGDLQVERLFCMPRQVWIWDEEARRWKRPWRMTNAIDEQGMYYMIDHDTPIDDAEALKAVQRVANLDGDL